MNEENKKVTITIYKGNEYCSTRNDIYIESDIFYENYCSAAVNLEDILRSSANFLNSEENNTLFHNSEPAVVGERLLGYQNNIIAFCADRGHGKTSAMLSFANALAEMRVPKRDLNKENIRDRFWIKAAGDDKNQEFVRNMTFQVLKYVDPTMIEESDSILRVLLVRLFNSFQQWREENEPCERGKRWTDAMQESEVLIDLFQKALHAIQLLLSKKVFDDSGDELDQIIEQGDVSNLRGLLYTLVHKYLKIVTGGDNSVLVVQIDDADLNTEKAYRIVEDIRRYLFMPQLVVLMALNLNQMESVVEQHFLQEFRTSLGLQGMVDAAACHDMAERYLDKILPGSRLIHLKNMDDHLRDGYNRLHISYCQRLPIEKELLSVEPNDKPASDMTYQQQLLGLLHRKTGLVFIVPEYLHDFLPHTMRELTHFLAFFAPMRDVVDGKGDVPNGGYACIFLEDEKDARQLWLNNVRRLKHYLLQVWASLNLREEERRFLRQLAEEGDVNWNLKVLKFLPEYYRHRLASGVAGSEADTHRNEYLSQCKERGIHIKDLPDRKYASYADVCEALKLLTEMPGGSDFYRFVYAVHLCYSIRLHELMLTNESLEERWKKAELILCNTLFHPKRVWPETKYGTMEKLVFEEQALLSVGDLPDNWETLVSSYCKKVIFFDTKPAYHTYERIKPSIQDPNQTNTGGRQPVSTDKPTQLEFDPFFSLHSRLYSGREYKGEELLEKNSDAEKMLQVCVDALLVLLNWDVQYLIMRRIAAKPGSSLKEWMEDNNSDLNTLFRENIQIPLFAQGDRDIAVFAEVDKAETGRILPLMDFMTNRPDTYSRIYQALLRTAKKVQKARAQQAEEQQAGASITEFILPNRELFEAIGLELPSDESRASGKPQESGASGELQNGNWIDKIVQEMDKGLVNSWFAGTTKDGSNKLDFDKENYEEDLLAALGKARKWWKDQLGKRFDKGTNASEG